MKPGIYYDLKPEDYHAMRNLPPMLSASTAKLLCNETPWHARYQHPRLNPDYVREDADHFDFGTVAHALMLQGLAEAHIIKATRWEGRGKARIDTGEPVEDYRGAEAREEREAARQAGKIPILANQWKRIELMVLSGQSQLKAHREAKDAFTGGKPEVTLIWQEGSVWCKARLDWLHDDYGKIDDYKTAANANPETLGRTIDNDGLDIQDAFYRRGIQVLTGIDPLFRFVFQEKSEPFPLCVVGLNPMWQTIGEKKRLFALELWEKCLSTNEWPGYPVQTCYPNMPKWAEDRWLYKETADVI